MERTSIRREAAEHAENTPRERDSARPPAPRRLRVVKRRRRDESGFALLLVLLMAALLALSLYKEIPRIAFETQRQKEELLVERGEQYKRALQVYVRALNHYPAKIEDLENTNNRHFLRRRYIDPMTGKDEWRLIHMQNGVLTDSKVQTQQQQNQQKDQTTAIGQTVGQVAGLGLDNSNPNQASAPNLATRHRASDGLPVAGTGAGTGSGTTDPNNPGATIPGSPPGYAPTPPGSTTTANGGQTGVPGTPGVPGIPGIPGVPGMPAAPGQPGQIYPTQFGGSIPAMPGTSGFGAANTGASTGNSGSGYLGGGGSYLGGGGSYLGGSSSSSGSTGTQAGIPSGISPNGGSSLPGGLNTPPNMQQPGMTTPGFMPPGTAGAMQQAQTPNGAALANMLGLTSPRPQGMPTTNTNGLSTLGGGIAGFASKADEDSIMVYNKQKNYGLWEFVFDPTKVPPLPNPLTGTVGTPGGTQIGTPATQVGTPAGQMSNSNTGFGNSGFGNSGFGSSGPGNSGFGNTGFGNSGGFGAAPSGASSNGNGTAQGTTGGATGGVGGMGFPPPNEPPPPPPPN